MHRLPPEISDVAGEQQNREAGDGTSLGSPLGIDEPVPGAGQVESVETETATADLDVDAKGGGRTAAAEVLDLDAMVATTVASAPSALLEPGDLEPAAREPAAREQIALARPVLEPAFGDRTGGGPEESWETELWADHVHPLLQTGHPVVRLLRPTVDIVGTAEPAPASKSHREKCTAIAAWLVLNPGPFAR